MGRNILIGVGVLLLLTATGAAGSGPGQPQEQWNLWPHFMPPEDTPAVEVDIKPGAEVQQENAAARARRQEAKAAAKEQQVRPETPEAQPPRKKKSFKMLSP